MSKVFYLKVNQDEEFTYRNLQHWVDILALIPEAEAFIVCDNPSVKENIFNKIYFLDTRVSVIQSSRITENIEALLLNVCMPEWRRAGLAHMTTFMHAKEHQYENFWNIDADDTCICLNAQRAAELLLTAENYAKEHKIALFSLDMWRTRYYGSEWSFGVTYTNNTVDWLGFMITHCLDDGYKGRTGTHNFDRYFMYLREMAVYSIESFYCENLKFIHYSDDFFRKIVTSGLFHWKQGYLRFPLLGACINEERLTCIKIAGDIIQLDIGITDEETSNYFIDHSLEKEALQFFSNEAEEHFAAIYRLFRPEIANYYFQGKSYMGCGEYEKAEQCFEKFLNETKGAKLPKYAAEWEVYLEDAQKQLLEPRRQMRTVFPFHKIPKGTRIAIYGAGVFGKIWMFQLHATNYCELSCFIDKNTELVEYSNIPVYPAETAIQLHDFDYVAISILDEEINRDAAKMLFGLGMRQDYVIYVDNFFN